MLRQYYIAFGFMKHTI